jgi:hypothetical protein
LALALAPSTEHPLPAVLVLPEILATVEGTHRARPAWLGRSSLWMPISEFFGNRPGPFHDIHRAPPY